MNDFWNEFGNNRHLRIVATAALGFLTLFLAVISIDAFMDMDRDDYPSSTITIDGVGSVKAVPDIANISFSVTEEAPTVAAAQDAASKRTNAALAALKTAGIEDKDITTSSYSSYPLYENQGCPLYGPCPSPKIRAYQTSQTISVKVRDVEKVGPVLQGLGDAGVQNISAPSFTTDDPENLRAEARDKAVENAKAKAEALADSLGVRLGKVVGFWENTDPGYPMPYAREAAQSYGGVAMDMAMAAPTIPVGEGEYEVRVSVTFELR